METVNHSVATGAPPTGESLSPQKQAQVLEGATVIFARDGYEGASMSEIARAAGVSKGTLYNYFDSKAALFAAYVQLQCRETVSRMMSDAQASDCPAEVLTTIARRMLEVMLSASGLTIYRVVIAEAEKFPALAQAFYDAGPARVIAFLAQYLTEETRRGRLVVADADLAAEQFIALCQTRLYLRRKLCMIAPPSAAEVEQIVSAAVRMFLAAYSA